MSTRDRLDSYIRQLEARLRLGALLRGGAVLTSVALAATVVLVFISNLFAFSAGSLTGARIALLLALAFAVGFGLALPLYGLDRRRAANKAEQIFPQFKQRLVTFAERNRDANTPMLDLLAADALDMADQAPPAQIVPNVTLAASLGLGLASLGVLLWMIMAAPGYMGHGASLLWTGNAHTDKPLYDLQVTPGDTAVRRNAEQTVTATVTGLQPNNVKLYMRYQSASKWEQLPMAAQSGASGYQYVFAGLPEGIEYYVEAGPLHSRHFNIKVVDLPAVKQIKVTYHYPSWTGQPNSVDEHGGDLRAVEGTQADLEVTTDRPMKDGMMVLDDGTQLKLDPGSGANLYRGTVGIDKDGTYHFSSADSGQQVRISDDFFIEARKASPPEVQIVRPARDYRASPIEEVTVAVKANDEFGLNDLALHYSVNGGPEKTATLLKQKGAKDADGSTTLYLEDYKMMPGDLVSVYATAKDARTEARTDMIFIQADPFEREFTQSQQTAGGGGGGGGQGGSPADISNREKEIIAETWKQQGDKTATKDQTADSAKFLAGVQAKLRDQALSLSGRLESRELSDQNQEFSDFQKDMNAAASAMDPASQKLGQQKWNDAIPNEQKALQYLLRAEATFRQIEVAFGARGGGGGGGGAGRDLASLFDLELDTEKNQFDTGETATTADQRAKDIDDALQKLDELARRQQDLANQTRNGTQTEQERWQQEMLRRDAEELQKQIQQLAQQNQNGQQGQQSGQQGQSSQQAQSGQGGQPGQSGQAGGQSGQQSSQSGQQGNPQSAASGGQQGSQQGSSDPRVQQALDQVRRAQDSMERAASQPNSDAARNAANQLRDALNSLNGLQQQQGGQSLDSMAKQAAQMSDAQRAQADQMRKLFGQANSEQGASGQQLQRLADDRQGLADQVQTLEKQMQQAQRTLAGSQPGAASKLRDALGGMADSDLANELKKSAQWLGQGIDPNADGSESEISAALQKLNDQLRQAQQAFSNKGQQSSDDALNRVDNIRDQMDRLMRGANPNDPRFLSGDDTRGNRQQGQNGQQNGQQGQQGGQQNGQQGQGQQGQGAQGGGQAGGNGFVAGLGGNQGDVGNGFTGGARDLRGNLRGFDIGNNTPQGTAERQPVQLTQADIDRAFQEAQRELNALKQDVQGQPQPLADINSLLEQMKHLDPSRFPGNPHMVEQLHDEVLATVDRLELQLRRDDDDKQTGQIRTGDSTRVPPGYQESVAEYFRRLSQTQKSQ